MEAVLVCPGQRGACRSARPPPKQRLLQWSRTTFVYLVGPVRRILSNRWSMKYCDFQTELLDDGTYRHKCTRPGCGNTLVSAAPRFRMLCQIQLRGPLPALENRDLSGIEAPKSRNTVWQSPLLVREAVSFVGAQARWLAAGCPLRSAERVKEIFAVCRGCENFKPGATEEEGVCRLCGCRLRSAGGLLNKIQMATEGCPAIPAKWTVEGALG